MANTVNHGSHRFAAPVDFDDEVSFGAAVENAAGRAESLGVHGVVQLSPGDYIEIFVTNNSGTTDVTVTDLQVLIAGVTG